MKFFDVKRTSLLLVLKVLHYWPLTVVRDRKLAPQQLVLITFVRMTKINNRWCLHMSLSKLPVFVQGEPFEQSLIYLSLPIGIYKLYVTKWNKKNFIFCRIPWNFIKLPDQLLPYFHPVFAPWMKVNEIQQIFNNFSKPF